MDVFRVRENSLRGFPKYLIESTTEEFAQSFPRGWGWNYFYADFATGLDEIILIQYVDVDTHNQPPPRTMAVASDRAAAMRWLQDEIDGKHSTTIRYGSGHDAAWWLAYGTFRLKSMEVQK